MCSCPCAEFSWGLLQPCSSNLVPLWRHLPSLGSPPTSKGLQKSSMEQNPLHWEGPQSNSSQQQLWCAHSPGSSSTRTILTTCSYHVGICAAALPNRHWQSPVLSALLWAGTTSNRPQEKWFGRGSCFEIFPRYTLFTIIHSLFWIKISYSWGNNIKTAIQSKRALLNFLFY